jgi:putative protease
MAEELNESEVIGKITHYFPKIGVAVIELTGTLALGDTIHIKGATTDFTQEITSMQIEHKEVEEALSGQSIGLKVNEPCREHDIVYRL